MLLTHAMIKTMFAIQEVPFILFKYEWNVFKYFI